MPQEFDCQPRPTRCPTSTELNLTANRRDGSYNFVARNEWIMADTPIVCNQVKIAVANPTVRNGDLDLLQAQISWVIVVWQELCPGRMCCKSLNLCHGLF